MKIGIITLRLYTNYGGILQAYALQTILKRMGYEVSHIEKEFKPYIPPIWKRPLLFFKRMLINFIENKKLVFSYGVNNKREIFGLYTFDFIHKYLHIVEYSDFSEIQEAEYDVLIVGSDQVWRPKYFYTKEIYNAYLKFAKKWNIKRIAYAASFGTNDWEYSNKQTVECAELIKLFDSVSVREKSAVNLCENKFGIKAIQVLDPTMLLECDDYIRLFKNLNIPKNTGNLYCYFLDETEEKKQLIRIISEEKNLTPFYVKPKSNNSNSNIEDIKQPPVEMWLRGFYDAEYVITDSFHACVFSILFQKPFIVYNNAKRGSERFESLLSMFGLQSCLINDISEIKCVPEPNWSRINCIIKKYREKSIKFLLTSIDN